MVTEVMVDQDDRVEAGELLVKLDREPFEVAAAQAEAGLEEARANVIQARAQVRSQIARARGAYYRRKNAQETLRRQIATLQAQFATLKARQSKVNNAAGLFNMLRNEGGSLGIAIATVLVDRRSQFHQLRLAEHITPLNPAVDLWTDYFAQNRMIRGGVTRAVADQQGMGLLTQMVHTQAREIAYLDPFWVFAVMALAALPLVLLMKKSVAKGGLTVH